MRVRLIAFGIAVAVIAAALPAVYRSMPPFGAHPLPYGDLVNQIGPAERHVTNMVSAVNFDIRGFDTLGEEIMLMTAVTGTAVLLRGRRGEEMTAKPATIPGRLIPPHSEALLIAGRLAIPMTVVFALYVVLHATVTPGGGFQGGVIIASGVLLRFLAEGYESWRRLMRNAVLDALEGGGAATYAIAGLASMLMGAAFLGNTLPFGELKQMLSGGLMLVLNMAVAFAVVGGFGVLFVEFLEETRAEESS
ncbi:MAG: sodium:proton antiporter [Acetobacteraceae bacterium]|nr:sodium:proton antiporter [Acetobacteraceae bacterium]